MIKLDTQADIKSLEQLAADLLKDIESLTLELSLYPKDSHEYSYLNGRIAGRDMVLMKIGYQYE
jgi:hypothetical protein